MADSQYVRDFKLRLDALKSAIHELEQTVTNAEVRDHFLTEPKHHLKECEAFIADPQNETVGIAGFALALAEKELVWVKKLVAKYGPNIKIVGG